MPYRSGFANRMIATAFDVSERQNRSCIVVGDGSPLLVSVYEKFGSKMPSKTTRYEGTVPTSANRDGLGTDIREVMALT